LNPLLGIDFGTTTTAAALVMGREITVVPHAGGALSIPSVVSFTPSSAGGRTLVGVEAAATTRHPERTITAVKRLLGRKLEAPEVRHQRQEAPYELVMAKNGDVRVRVGRRHLSPPDIAGYVFDAVRTAASRLAGQPVEEAVIAMPADFNDLQRQAVGDAARIGGLKVVGSITGPAAVALGAGLYPLPRGADSKKDHRVLIYDLGGGSFDVAALVVREEGMEVLASGGDAFLGGEDFDQRIVSFICEEFLRAGGSDLRRERLILPRLRVAAERAKLALSSEDEVQIRLPELAARLPEGVRLTRDRLDSLTQDLIDRTVWPCESVLRHADWSVEEVDALVMVGGQTHMPRVRAHIADWLGKAPLDLPSPPEALVALGAARQGVALEAAAAGGRGRKRKGSMPVVEATCLSLGVESAGGVVARLIPKGTPLPARASQGLTTSTDNQAHVVVHLVQGEREMAADNDSIARLQIGPLPPAPRGTPQVEFEIVTDGGGLPRVAARDVTTGEPIGVRLRPSGGLTEAELTALVAIHAGTPAPVSPAAAAGSGDEAGAPAAMVALSSGPEPLVDPNEHRG